MGRISARCSAMWMGMIQDKEFTNLKGVLYFTDGEGVYPEKQPTYRTAFVFVRDDLPSAGSAGVGDQANIAEI